MLIFSLYLATTVSLHTEKCPKNNMQPEEPKNKNKNPTTATCNLLIILLSVYLISSTLFVRHPFSKAEAQNTSAQGKDSKSRKVESNKGTLASELRFGLLSDAVWAGLFFFKNVFQSKKGS